jgi:hypothetical protein
LAFDLILYRYAVDIVARQGYIFGAYLLFRSKRPACLERCQLDLPGFQNLEGLLSACFSPNV